MRKFLFVICAFIAITCGSRLSAQNSSQRSIKMTTTKQVGEKARIQVYADDADKDNIWIDWNGDGKGDEQITEFYINDTEPYEEYTIRSQNFSVIGNVKYFACEENNLTKLDVSRNNILRGIRCNDNQIKELDVHNNTRLTSVECMNNLLQRLDFSNCPELDGLKCFQNKLTELNVLKNSKLSILGCGDNLLPELNLSGARALDWLACGDNLFTELDLSHNINLTTLYCNNNHLSELDFSNNKKLWLVHVVDGTIKTLNLNGADNLESLLFIDNKLTSLDVSTNKKLRALNIRGNNLSACALDALYESMPIVDKTHPFGLGNVYLYGNPGYPGSKTSLLEGKNWEGYEEGTGKGCEAETSGISFEEKAQTVAVFPNPASDYITVSVPENVRGSQLKIVAISGKTVFAQTITEDEFRVYVNNFAKGVYLIKIGDRVEKLIIN